MSGLPSHLELVQGVVLPRPVGGDPVLDFLNTRSEWTDHAPPSPLGPPSSHPDPALGSTSGRSGPAVGSTSGRSGSAGSSIPTRSGSAGSSTPTRSGSAFGPARTEWLTSYEVLVIWTGYVQLLPDAAVPRLIAAVSAKPAEAARRLRAALDFRADLYGVLSGADPGSFDAAARVIEKATARRQLVSTGDTIDWELPEDPALPLDAIAVRAGDLLTSPTRTQIRSCAGCGWLFLDPRGRRRWCSMATCGNRAKVRAHAARTR